MFTSVIAEHAIPEAWSGSCATKEAKLWKGRARKLQKRADVRRITVRCATVKVGLTPHRVGSRAHHVNLLQLWFDRIWLCILPLAPSLSPWASSAAVCSGSCSRRHATYCRAWCRPQIFHLLMDRLHPAQLEVCKDSKESLIRELDKVILIARKIGCLAQKNRK